MTTLPILRHSFANPLVVGVASIPVVGRRAPRSATLTPRWKTERKAK
jgi:hypothetical protein